MKKTKLIREERAVGRLAEIIALEYGIPQAKSRQIGIAASIHDFGKLKIPKSILEKPGRLTKEEFEVMKTHTILGAEMMNSITGEMGKMTRTIARHHHDFWDGGGYWGYRASELPIYVSITSLADVTIALLNRRVYKEPWSLKDVMAYIFDRSGTQFSPKLVEAFLPLMKKDKRVVNIFEQVAA